MSVYPTCKGCGDQYPLTSKIPLCRYCLEQRITELEAEKEQWFGVAERRLEELQKLEVEIDLLIEHYER
jgi:hypothetical protein